MLILGIETSCDDTCISVVKVKSQKSKVKSFEILSNVVSSQVKLHAKYGGVWPFLAKREHQKNLPIVFQKAIKGIGVSKIDLIGVTIGPGLEPCLWQGINFAKELAEKLKKPLIPVNHLEAHILVNFLSSKFPAGEKMRNLFPAICLVVSGGHTVLFLMEKIGKYKLIGETRDDAAGECFDKVARILGLGYPGGPAIATFAYRKKNAMAQILRQLPRPMIYQRNYDFSFAGLKTAVLYDFKKRPLKIRESREYLIEMCQEIQQAIIDVLNHKILKATKEFRAKSIILGGGVAANKELRKQFKSNVKSQRLNVKFLVPPKIFCLDNAAMVAITTFFHKKEKFDLPEIKANANLKI